MLCYKLREKSVTNVMLYINYHLKKPDFIQIDKVEYELKEHLKNIDPSLHNKLVGAWETFHSSSSDKKAQGAHSIRDILRDLICRWASNEEVKKADWWQNDENSRDGVSLKQRFRFLIYGPRNESYNEQELELIEKTVQKCYEDNTYLTKIAHGSEKGSIQLVESTMKAIETIMLTIITARQKYPK